jgi:hypothetical protein
MRIGLTGNVVCAFAAPDPATIRVIAHAPNAECFFDITDAPRMTLHDARGRP